MFNVYMIIVGSVFEEKLSIIVTVNEMQFSFVPMNGITDPVFVL